MGLLWPDFQANSVYRMRRGCKCECTRGERDVSVWSMYEGIICLCVLKRGNRINCGCKLCLCDPCVCMRDGCLSSPGVYKGLSVSLCEQEREKSEITK